jgi:pimeloyl-ACP methyl ester carboxylesterase
MSAITIENDLVHYEVLGRGRPVILLHGWLGSWRYWIPAMQQLSAKYRTYALDLWGFGDSGKDERHYDFAAQVMLLEQFMEKMGIAKAALVGHSLGAAISVRYAAQHPEQVPRLMVVSPPLFRMAPAAGALTSNPPPARQLPAQQGEQPSDQAPGAASTDKPASDKPPLDKPSPQFSESETMPFRSDEMKLRIQSALNDKDQSGPLAKRTPKSPREAATPPTDQPATEESVKPQQTPQLPESLSEVPQMPQMSSAAEVQRANPLKEHLGAFDPVGLLQKHVEAGGDLEKLKVEVGKADKKVIEVSVESFAGVDILRDLQALSMPALVVHGANDSFLPPPDSEMIASLKQGRKTFNLITLADTRHFPMLESSAPFNRLLLDFLEAPDVTKIAIKEIWERRVR